MKEENVFKDGKFVSFEFLNMLDVSGELAELMSQDVYRHYSNWVRNVMAGDIKSEFFNVQMNCRTGAQSYAKIFEFFQKKNKTESIGEFDTEDGNAPETIIGQSKIIEYSKKKPGRGRKSFQHNLDSETEEGIE